MKLLTADIIHKLRKSPLYSHEKDAPEKVEIIVKFFHAGLELKKARGNFGLPIERDMYYGKRFLSEVL